MGKSKKDRPRRRDCKGDQLPTVLKELRKRKLQPLRLIHPEHVDEPLYEGCYERFFRTVGIPRTDRVLYEVAKMPSLLRVRRGYKGRHTNPDDDENCTESHDHASDKVSMEAPSEDIMKHINAVLCTMRPCEFDAAGFDENDPSHITEESLVKSIGHDDLVSLSK